jgi:hypothetical protein
MYLVMEFAPACWLMSFVCSLDKLLQGKAFLP